MDAHTFHDRTIETAEGFSYTPYVAEDGRVGYIVADDQGRHKLVYLTPSNGEDEGMPNVFVYVGEEDNPALDVPQCFCLIEYE